SKRPQVDLRVSKTCLRRALLISNALLKALEARGFSIELPKNGGRDTRIDCEGGEGPFFILGKVDRSEPGQDPSPKPEPYSWQPRWTYTPTGKLVFVIDMYEDLRKKRWSDRKSLPLEEQLNDIVVGIRAAAAVRRAVELRRQEEARRRAEEERRREELARI